MLKLYFVYGFMALCNLVIAQQPEELVAIFFKGMYEADTVKVKSIFVSKPSFFSLTSSKLKDGEVEKGQLSDFLKILSKHKPGDLDEKTSNIVSHVEKNLANVIMDYNFYYKGKFSHCGINAFHFLKTTGGWKCTGIDDTHYSEVCEAAIIEKADNFLNDWHMAATKADSASYFTKLHDKSIFIGTDSSEVWTKTQFVAFAGPYFAKGKAWDFKKISRNLHYEAVKKIVWFDEMLATWMGPCRGSGFMSIDENGGLSIMQYVLSVTVPNEKINKVIEAIKSK